MTMLSSELTYKYALEAEKKYQYLLNQSFPTDLDEDRIQSLNDSYTPRIHRTTVAYRPADKDRGTLFQILDVSTELDIELSALEALAKERQAHILTFLFTARPAHAENTANFLNQSLTAPAHILIFRPVN